MLDTNFIQRKIKLIHEDISKLEPLGNYTFDEVAQDYVKFSALERLLEKIIIRAVDINQHIIAEIGKGDERIRSYEDTFNILANFNIYSSEFAKQIAPSAGLRNRLVHEYNDTDDKIIYQSVGEAIKQYTQYCGYILKFLEKH